MNTPRLDYLLQVYFDGDISAEEAAELEVLLRTRPEARAGFWGEAHMHSLLRDWGLEGRTQLELEALSSVHPAPRKSSPFAWWRRVGWRPWVAAAVGVALGVLCTSMVSGYVAGNTFRALTVFQDGFEAGPSPEVTGMAVGPERWGGDFSAVVEQEQEVRPVSGKKMLRLLRADYAGKAKPEGSFIADMYRLIDLRPFRREFGADAVVAELSAAFNAARYPEGERYGCTLSIHALDAEFASRHFLFSEAGVSAEALAFSRAFRGVLDNDPASWQRLSTELRLPPGTDFLLIRLGVGYLEQSQRRVEFAGHYVDDVRVALARRAPLH